MDEREIPDALKPLAEAIGRASDGLVAGLGEVRWNDEYRVFVIRSGPMGIVIAPDEVELGDGGHKALVATIARRLAQAGTWVVRRAVTKADFEDLAKQSLVALGKHKFRDLRR
jgi:hypothetical protein